MHKKLIALAIAGLTQGIRIPDSETFREYSFDYHGQEQWYPQVNDGKRKTSNRPTGIAAAKRAAKKRRNRK